MIVFSVGNPVYLYPPWSDFGFCCSVHLAVTNLLSNILINFCDVTVFLKLNHELNFSVTYYSNISIHGHLGTSRLCDWSAAIGRLVLVGDLRQAVRILVSCSEFSDVRGSTLLCAWLYLKWTNFTCRPSGLHHLRCFELK